MNSELLSLLLITHVIADFYLQTDEMAKDKLKYLRKHIIQLSVLILLVGLIFYRSISMLIIGVIIILTHLIIDIIKIKLDGKISTLILFICDQGAHLLVIFLSVYLLGNIDRINIIEIMGILTDEVLSISLVLLLIGKPVSIMIKLILKNYDHNDFDKGIKNAGSLIGILERIFIFLMLFLGQFGAIGLVLTAKSIVRYNEISKDIKFSEYYLLGTLLSTISVIVITLLIL